MSTEPQSRISEKTKVVKLSGGIDLLADRLDQLEKQAAVVAKTACEAIHQIRQLRESFQSVKSFVERIFGDDDE